MWITRQTKLGFSYRKVTARKAKEIVKNTIKSGTFENTQSKDGHVVNANKQLERIRILKFLGDNERISEYKNIIVVGSVFQLCG